MTEQKLPSEPFGAAGRVVDPVAMARRGANIASTTAVSHMERLCSALASDDGMIDWQAEFESVNRNDGGYQSWLTLRFKAPVELACSFCAEPMATILDGEARFMFVNSEDEAARLDEQADDFDVLATDERFDLLGLLEDELIMAVPLLAHHETCPGNAEAADQASENDERQQPFEGLAAKIAAATKGKS